MIINGDDDDDFVYYLPCINGFMNGRWSSDGQGVDPFDRLKDLRIVCCSVDSFEKESSIILLKWTGRQKFVVARMR